MPRHVRPRLCAGQYYFWRVDVGTSNAFLVRMLDRPTLRLGVPADPPYRDRRRDARQLTGNEIRQFYEAYRVTEARACLSQGSDTPSDTA